MEMRKSPFKKVLSGLENVWLKAYNSILTCLDDGEAGKNIQEKGK